MTKKLRPVGSSHSTSTRYFLRVVTVFVVVVTETSTTVVPNPSLFVSVDWWEQVQDWFPGFLSYGGSDPGPVVGTAVVADTDSGPASNVTRINSQILHGSKLPLPLRCT